MNTVLLILSLLFFLLHCVLGLIDLCAIDPRLLTVVSVLGVLYLFLLAPMVLAGREDQERDDAWMQKKWPCVEPRLTFEGAHRPGEAWQENDEEGKVMAHVRARSSVRGFEAARSALVIRSCTSPDGGKRCIGRAIAVRERDGQPEVVAGFRGSRHQESL